MAPKVSVVVPIYNVEQYIERCVRSLMEQTLQDMEFIFVDDCTPDLSVEVLKNVLVHYPKREKQIKILKNAENRGLLQTRIIGFLQATGRYIGTVDSDDWIELDAFEILYNQAITENTECVIFGYYRDFADHSESCQRVFGYNIGKELVANVYRFPFEFFLWGNLLKNDMRLKNVIRQYADMPEWEGLTMWEDVAVMFPYYYGTQRLSYSKHCYYHYNKANENSAVSKQNESKVYQALRVVDYLREKMNEPSLDLTFHNLAFGAKNPLIGLKGPKCWREEHSESNRHILQFTSIPKYLRYLLFLMAHGISFPYFWSIKIARVLKL